MSLLTDILNRYLGAGINAPAAQAQDDFDHVARHVPNDVLSQGISTALGSPQTPPAGELVSQMFEASTPEQRAAMLNQLISALGPNAPSVLGGLLANAGVSGAGGMPTITPNEASRVRPEQVQDVVTGFTESRRRCRLAAELDVHAASRDVLHRWAHCVERHGTGTAVL